MKPVRRVLAGAALASGLFLGTAGAQDSAAPSRPETRTEPPPCEAPLNGKLFSRTELFFGLSRPNGPDVSDEAFQRFVDAEVTPWFPDGLTILSARGQYKDASGNVAKEQSRIIILLHPLHEDSNRALERIRQAYRETFQQQSVLRVDARSCVSY